MLRSICLKVVEVESGHEFADLHLIGKWLSRIKCVFFMALLIYLSMCPIFPYRNPLQNFSKLLYHVYMWRYYRWDLAFQNVSHTFGDFCDDLRAFPNEHRILFMMPIGSYGVGNKKMSRLDSDRRSQALTGVPDFRNGPLFCEIPDPSLSIVTVIYVTTVTKYLLCHNFMDSKKVGFNIYRKITNVYQPLDHV